jgi:acyl carrier protein phosphodiesterase
MNYLAHAYLSFGEPDILAGNMISDFVKGKKNSITPTVSKWVLHCTVKLMSIPIPTPPPAMQSNI